jgi:hypothetical protein
MYSERINQESAKAVLEQNQAVSWFLPTTPVEGPATPIQSAVPQTPKMAEKEPARYVKPAGQDAEMGYYVPF